MEVPTGFDLSVCCFLVGRGGIPFYLHFADNYASYIATVAYYIGWLGRWDQGRTGRLLLAFLITHRVVDGVGFSA